MIEKQYILAAESAALLNWADFVEVPPAPSNYTTAEAISKHKTRYLEKAAAGKDTLPFGSKITTAVLTDARGDTTATGDGATVYRHIARMLEAHMSFAAEPPLVFFGISVHDVVYRMALDAALSGDLVATWGLHLSDGRNVVLDPVSGRPIARFIDPLGTLVHTTSDTPTRVRLLSKLIPPLQDSTATTLQGQLAFIRALITRFCLDVDYC